MRAIACSFAVLLAAGCNDDPLPGCMGELCAPPDMAMRTGCRSSDECQTGRFCDVDGVCKIGCDRDERCPGVKPRCCEHTCWDVASDPGNCGACGMRCQAAQNANVACVAGKCVVTGCIDGFGDCDGLAQTGCETDTAHDPGHCGSCAVVCGGLAHVDAYQCAESVCAIAQCEKGFANCDGTDANGCEASLLDDPANCGKCGSACMNGQACKGGKCVVVSTVFTGDFFGGVGSPMQCMGWDAFRMSLTGNYMSVNIKGTFDMAGVTCKTGGNNEANQIAMALLAGNALSIQCSGRTWVVGSCGNGIELTAGGNGLCSCSQGNGFTVRPCIGMGNFNWGGVGTPTCMPPTQTITVTFQ